MLVRTNIYLDEQVRRFFQRRAKAERVTMAEKIRQVLDEEARKVKGNWAQSMLRLSRQAGGSGLGDLSRNHDKYLLEKE